MGKKGYSNIVDLNGSTETWAIEVRVCRLWEAVDFKTNNEAFALEMVFVDNQGDAIQGYIRNNHMTKFKGLLNEGEVYIIRNFKVGQASPHYRVVPNTRRIYLNITTSVNKADPTPAEIPPHAFFFAPVDALEGRVGDNTLLTDIIGCVVGVGPTQVAATGPMKEVEVQNSDRAIMKMTFWGNTALTFDVGPYEDAGTPIIVAITSTTIRTFKGQYSYKSTTATRVYFNLPLPEVSVLAQMFVDGYTGIRKLGDMSTPSVPLAEQAQLNRTTIRELLAMEWVADKQEHVCTVLAEIVEINTRYGWCYISCKQCKKKVVPENGSFNCPTCKKTCPYPVVRYKIHARAEDATGSTTLVIFNDDAEKLLKVPARTFMDRLGAGDKTLPLELSNLIGKKIVFKVKVTDYNLKDGLENYMVTKIFEEVAAEHKRKVTTPQPKIHGGPSEDIEGATSDNAGVLQPLTPHKNAPEVKKLKIEK